MLQSNICWRIRGGHRRICVGWLDHDVCSSHYPMSGTRSRRFGRVASMWMVSEMMKEESVVHRVVRKEEEADEFMYEILNTEGLIFELFGHVFINRRGVKRYNRWLNWSNIFGIVVRPFNVKKLILGGR
ncbi:hypothetical protein F4804DRAFT_5031 [Jackrogersella minutella]|nr:hypothetical protein F4804DRAFT_5031 [Jackrogersella minutella]